MWARIGHVKKIPDNATANFAVPLEGEGANEYMKNRAHLKLSIRVPEKWAGEINSHRLKSWLSDFVADPFLLPRDRGPAEGLIIRLSVPGKLFRSFRRKVQGAASSALRRLISTRLTNVDSADVPRLPEPVSPRGWHEGRAISLVRWQRLYGVTGRASLHREDCRGKGKKR
jgi:hypothetical protein